MWALLFKLIPFQGLLEAGLNGWLKSKNIDLEKFKAGTAAEQATIIAAVQGDNVRISAQRDVILAAMSHKVWWWAWGLFVFPVGLYHAAIFLLSVASIGPDTYAVLRVPGEQEQWARDIIKTIFALQAGTGVASAALETAKTIYKR